MLYEYSYDFMNDKLCVKSAEKREKYNPETNKCHMRNNETEVYLYTYSKDKNAAILRILDFIESEKDRLGVIMKDLNCKIIQMNRINMDLGTGRYDYEEII